MNRRTNERHYCKVCNAWMASDKMSIRTHQNGSKHKQKIAEALKAKRDEKASKEREEKQLMQQMADIENAARAAVSSDRDLGQLSFYNNNAPAVPVGPPPSHSSQQHQPQTPTVPVVDIKKEDRGNKKQEKRIIEKRVPATLETLSSGITCELYFEDSDCWKPGVISIVNDDGKTFDITYFKSEERGAMVPEMESNVSVDRIQLIVQLEEAAKSEAEHTKEVEQEILQTAPVVESSGLGRWQTLSVREVNDEEEEKENEKRERALEIQRKASYHKKPKANEGVKTQSASSLADDMMLGAENLYDAHVYKGVEVHAIKQEEVESEMNSLAGGHKVSFKRRKKMSVAGMKVKQEDDDEDALPKISAIANSKKRDKEEIEVKEVADREVKVEEVAPVKKVSMSMGIKKGGLKRKILME